MSLRNEAPQEDPRIVALRQRFPEGAHVRLTADAERYPHFIARKGSTGVVSHNTDGGIEVKLDQHLPGAEAWENEVVWVDADLIWEGYPDGWREPELEIIASEDAQPSVPKRGSPSFAVKFEQDHETGEPVAFVSGVMESGAYVVDRSGWVRSGWTQGEDPNAAPPWLEAALNALSAEWWMRAERAEQAERSAGWRT